MSNNTALNNTQTSESVSSKTGQSAGAFAASLVVSIIVFAVEVLVFILVKDRLARIYQPRTFLVPQKERTSPAAPGWWKWIKPVLSTSNSEFIQKCGLDAYFFLRYLRMLLKIFVPAALVILPILLPLNSVDGRGSAFAVGKYRNAANVTGLDQLSWGNVAPNHTGRYWAHWTLALCLVVYFSYICFDELRGYIRMRQAYLTSPQHRLRASATTVLVSSIPHKWCSVEALDGLYDVFPGGLRNIWINRNFDELSGKVQRRDKLAKKLEAAETDLVKKCFKKYRKDMAKAAKNKGEKMSKEEKKRQASVYNETAAQNAMGSGMTSGDPHQVRHNLHEALNEDVASDHDTPTPVEEQPPEDQRDKPSIPIPIIGDGLHAAKEGISNLGKEIIGNLKGVNKGVNSAIDTQNGYVPPTEPEPSKRHRSGTTPSERFRPVDSSAVQFTSPSEVDGSTEERPNSEHGSKRLNDWHQGRKPAKVQSDKPLHPEPSPESEPDRPEKSTSQPASKLEAVKKAVGLASEPREPIEYPSAFDEELEKDDDKAIWRRYIEEKDRDTYRLPIFGWSWMPSLPLIGKKVDTIYYCRKEVARLNVEIEDDQAHPERFPLMNSAFIQFNHQVAAHMACQSVSHHIPQQMAPRLVEIDPNDVIWNNMSIPWWQNYIRTAIVVTVVTGMIILWAIPVAFTSALSQLTVLAQTYSWLSWLSQVPTWFRSVLQGVLPPALLGLLVFLLPIILRLLAKLQGIQSGMLVELSVQKYYFFFLFVQLFLVVTVAAAVSVIISYLKDLKKITDIPTLLATNIPKASNYFFSYMLLQAMSVSAGALVQVGNLFSWFILAPLLDSTARQKFRRQTSLSEVNWGTFFPFYTNLACIGLIYSIISPLILVFNVITFSLFWFVYRYNTLYVTKFARDTGGLLFPNAINTMFTGIYVMEIALIFMFLIVRDTRNRLACKGQAIGMVVILLLTIIFQWLLNQAFSPLFRYLPITLEDDAVRRDEEFARAMHNKRIGIIENEIEGEDLQDELERRERQSREEDRQAEEYELQQIAEEKRRRLEKLNSQKLPPLEHYEYQNPEIAMPQEEESRAYKIIRKTAQRTADVALGKLPTNLPIPGTGEKRRSSWADRSQNRRSSHFGEYTSASPSRERGPPAGGLLDKINNFNPLLGNEKDVEAQRVARNQLSEAIFAGVNDELEDLSPDQRDSLVQRAFQHSALRARRPVIWIPRDELGVSDDEVHRMGKFSKNLWVSNVRQGLDSKGRCVYSGAPPDFSEVDFIKL